MKNTKLEKSLNFKSQRKIKILNYQEFILILTFRNPILMKKTINQSNHLVINLIIKIKVVCFWCNK